MESFCFPKGSIIYQMNTDLITLLCLEYLTPFDVLRLSVVNKDMNKKLQPIISKMVKRCFPHLDVNGGGGNEFCSQTIRSFSADCPPFLKFISYGSCRSGKSCGLLSAVEEDEKVLDVAMKQVEE